jgi:hypothetical protein
MLTPATRLRLQEISGRISNEQPVSLHERISLQTFADRDPSVADGDVDGASGWWGRR